MKGDEPEYCFVFYEILRDIENQHSWVDSSEAKSSIALHEIGHCFELEDNGDESGGKPSNAMWAPGTDSKEDNLKDIPFEFKDSDINIIRDTVCP